MPQNIIIFKPNQRFDTGFLEFFVIIIKNIYKCRELISQLLSKSLFALYKKSFIGSVWIVITPIIGIISWVFLQKANILTPGDIGIPYPVYVLVGSLVWGLFMGCYNGATSTLIGSQDLLKHINFPHETLFIMQILVRVVNFTVSVILTLIILLIFSVKFSVAVLLFPIVVIPLLLLASSAGLVAGMISVVSYDFHRLITAAVSLVLYITPVVYSADAVTNTLLKKIVMLNPLTYLVCSARDVILFGRLYSPSGYYISAFLSVILFWWSLRLFYIAENRLVERVL